MLCVHHEYLCVHVFGRESIKALSFALFGWVESTNSFAWMQCNHIPVRNKTFVNCALHAIPILIFFARIKIKLIKKANHVIILFRDWSHYCYYCNSDPKKEKVLVPFFIRSARGAVHVLCCFLVVKKWWWMNHEWWSFFYEAKKLSKHLVLQFVLCAKVSVPLAWDWLALLHWLKMLQLHRR